VIVRSEFIRLNGQAAHLSRADTNRTVVIRTDLARNAPDNLLDMTRYFAAIARTNPRTERDLVHLKVSPAHPLDDVQLARALEVIEEEFGIAATTPRGVVEHDKGERPRHFHILYPLVDPVTGRAIRSDRNYFKDEIISRRLELEFGEAIVPGPRMAEVVDELARRGQTAEVEALETHPAVQSGARFGHEIRQQAERLGVNLQNFAETVLGCWTEAAGNGEAFTDRLTKCEMRVAQGKRAVLVLDDRTGFNAPLARVLRQVTKARAERIEVREPELRNLLPQLPELVEARDAGLDRAAADARIAIEREIARFAAEAIAEAQGDLARRLKKAREAERARRREAERRSLTERRAEIVAFYRRRDRIRWARVNRAFIAARWAATPATRKLAFIAAAGSVALAGGGLGLALVAGGLAAGLLPTFEHARALAVCAAAARAQDLNEQRELMDRIYVELKRTAPDLLDFNKVPKSRRIAAGFIAHCAVVGDDSLDGDNLAALRRAERCIGSPLAEEIRRAVLAGPRGGAERLLGWYRWGESHSGKALEAALRAHEHQIGRAPAGHER